MQALSIEQESHDSAIKHLLNDARALQASQNIVNECRADFTTLHSKVDNLMAWKRTTSPPLIKVDKLHWDFQHFLRRETEVVQKRSAVAVQPPAKRSSGLDEGIVS